MTRDTLRIMARKRWPVVQTETGAHGEIGYPYIREIKVVYASEDDPPAKCPGCGRKMLKPGITVRGDMDVKTGENL